MVDNEGAVPQQMRLTDAEVASFLAEFRDRPQERQETSIVWQELMSFPQWAGAQYRGDETPSLPAPPDPRLSGRERQEEYERTGQEPPTVTPNPDGSQSMTTGNTAKAANPWGDHPSPPDDGSAVFVAVNTDQRPPYAGDWERRPGGWFRRGKE
jgi:hypothetical protein